MKSNKVTVYILLTLVIGIWGYVIYIVIGNWEGNKPSKIAKSNKIDELIDLNYYRWKDTIPQDSLIRSPFLTSGAEKEKSETNINSEITPANFSEKVYDPLAYAPAIDIRYFGFIENQRNAEKVALVIVNGKQIHMKIRQKIDGIILQSIFTNEIIVKTGQHTINIPKE